MIIRLTAKHARLWPTGRSQHVVHAVAEWRVICRLAATQIERPAFLRDEAVGKEARDLMRGVVTEGLPLRPSARAPEIGPPGFERHLKRALLGADRLVRHDDVPLVGA